MRNHLPKGYKPLGAILSIKKYPVAYSYFKGTSPTLQDNCPSGYFRLPRGGFYAKGTDNITQAGAFMQEGLPDVNAGSWTRVVSRYSLGGKGGGASDDWGARGNNENLSLSRFNPVYGRTQSVEVNHTLFLEGIYVGGGDRDN